MSITSIFFSILFGRFKQHVVARNQDEPELIINYAFSISLKMKGGPLRRRTLIYLWYLRRKRNFSAPTRSHFVISRLIPTSNWSSHPLTSRLLLNSLKVHYNLTSY